VVPEAERKHFEFRSFRSLQSGHTSFFPQMIRKKLCVACSKAKAQKEKMYGPASVGSGPSRGPLGAGLGSSAAGRGPATGERRMTVREVSFFYFCLSL
jgi:hypothetical protein